MVPLRDKSDLGRGREEAQRRSNICLGICAMEKKASSKPMKRILEHIVSMGGIDIVPFPEDVILNRPIEEWPHPVDMLVSFFSDGFPLDKAEAYVALRGPHCINDLTAQRLLLDRRKVYALLEENGIPHPQALVVERNAAGELQGEAAKHFSEAEDYLCIGEDKIAKPFVEKPVDAEDHNICIYYPSSMGGGVKRLFRKVGDQSSKYDPTGGCVRRDGTYMYEPFMKTQGTDIKIYTVGPEYAHAEARKSPVLDGVVTRDEDGKEMRVPVVLTPREKEIARRVCLAFGQTVCGFDLLRTTKDSFVIDVNGWSFVKGVDKYYEDAAMVLHDHIMKAMGFSPLLKPRRQPSSGCISTSSTLTEKDSAVPTLRSDRWQHEELLAVLAVLRHGDRTPKNKMKFVTRRSEVVALHKRWAGGSRKEVKLKTPKQLQEVLDLTTQVLEQASESPVSGGEAEPVDSHTADAMSLISAVLREGGHFDGIYRKVQIKPTAWSSSEEVLEVLLILKYGGILTPAGVRQAERLGRHFREVMYPTELDTVASAPAKKASNGLLRLHATQRHDFKVYSSDEGRVQMSAAAFTRGLLDLEAAALTPICAALVETDPAMLDDLPTNAEAFLKDAKEELQKRIAGRLQDFESSACGSPTGTSASWGRLATPMIVKKEELAAQVPTMVPELRALQRHVDAVCRELAELDKEHHNVYQSVLCGEGSVVSESPSPVQCCSTSSPLLVWKRWEKLQGDLWNSKLNTWNTAKVPEIYDAVKFDLIHHPNLASEFAPLYDVAKRINDVMVPNEYGHDPKSRTKIGAMVCCQLLRKLLVDLRNSSGGGNAAGEELPKLQLVTAVQYLKRIFAVPKWLSPQKDGPALPNKVDMENEEEFREAELAQPDPRHAVGYMSTPHRRVRTRLYFTSESHIQTLMNVLRYCHLAPDVREDNEEAGKTGIVCGKAEEALKSDPVFDYLTHVVFRLYEDKLAPLGSPSRYRVEVLFSSGASGYPTYNPTHTMDLQDLQPLHTPGAPLTLVQLQKLLGPFAKLASEPDENAPGAASGTLASSSGTFTSLKPEESPA